MAERGAPRGKRSRQQAKRFYHTLILVVVGLLCTLLVALVQPFSSINRWLSDQLFTSEPPSPNIVVLGIDNETLGTYGRWADWPRHLHTQAIENLTAAGDTYLRVGNRLSVDVEELQYDPFFDIQRYVIYPAVFTKKVDEISILTVVVGESGA